MKKIHLHITALADSLPCQYFRCLPLPQLHGLLCSTRVGLCPPTISRAQSPQLHRQILTDENATGCNVSVNAQLSVQVVLGNINNEDR